MKTGRAFLILSFLTVAQVGIAEEIASIPEATGEAALSPQAHIESGDRHLADGEPLRAWAEYAAAWRSARVAESGDPGAALLAAGPYGKMLRRFVFFDALYWMAEEALEISGEIEDPQEDVRRSLGWVHSWLLARYRIAGEFDTARRHASEALSIAEETEDAELRACTRLELVNLYLSLGDSVGAEMQILKCRAEPLYRDDADYRVQCDLRMEETHLAAGRAGQAATIVGKIVEDEDVAFHYRLESLYHLGKHLRESGELVGAVRPLCLGVWLHTDFGHWQYQCIVQRDQLFQGRSGKETFLLLEQARGAGPRDATAAIEMEFATRFPDEAAGREARDRLDALTPESVTPMMWDAILQFRLDPGSDPGQVAAVYEELIRRNADEYRRMMKLLDEAFDAVEGRDPGDWSLAFLERVRPVIPPPLYHHDRMEILMGNGRMAEAAEEARLFFDAENQPGFFDRFPYARIAVTDQHALANECRLRGALEAGGVEAIGPAIEELEREAVDPAIAQRALMFFAFAPRLRDKPEIKLQLLNRSLAIDCSPISRARALMRKASLLSYGRNRAEAARIYRAVAADDAYLGPASFYIAQAHRDLARMAERRGDLESAIAEYKTLIARRDEIGQTAAWGYEGLAEIYLSQQRTADAETVIDAGIGWLDEESRESVRLQMVRAKILARKGDEKSARELVDGFLTEDRPDWCRNMARRTLEELDRGGR